MLEPVVVKPETISKKASATFGISPERRNGKHPNALIASQLSATESKPSFA